MQPYTFTFLMKTPRAPKYFSGNGIDHLPAGSGLSVNLMERRDQDPLHRATIRSSKKTYFFINPNCTCQLRNSDASSAVRRRRAAGRNGSAPWNQLHASDMPFCRTRLHRTTVPAKPAQGALFGSPAACDVGNGVCRTSATRKNQSFRAPSVSIHQSAITSGCSRAMRPIPSSPGTALR